MYGPARTGHNTKEDRHRTVSPSILTGLLFTSSFTGYQGQHYRSSSASSTATARDVTFSRRLMDAMWYMPGKVRRQSAPDAQYLVATMVA